MVNAVKWADPTSRTTSIAGISMAAGANALSDAIENETNKDRYLALELVFHNSGTPSATGGFMETYLLYAQDGTNYEDGSVSVDPKRTFDNVFINTGASGVMQRQNIPDIPINPFNFKILLKSEFTGAISGVTLSAHTYNEEIQ